MTQSKLRNKKTTILQTRVQ